MIAVSTTRIEETVTVSNWMKKNVADNKKVLMVAFTTPYRFEKPFLNSSPIDEQYIDEALDFCSSPEALRDYLVKQEFGYILFLDG